MLSNVWTHIVTMLMWSLNQLGDFFVVDEAVRKFEAVSGAILSRNKKCTVMGI